MTTVMERAAAGAFATSEELEEALDDAVEEWHGAETDLGLPEWLGMTGEQYAGWVMDPSSIDDIVKGPPDV